MNLQKMMKQAQEMQSRVGEMQARIEAQEEDGGGAGGMVSVRINGRHDLLKVAIDPSLMTLDEKETVEDLIIAAYRNAREKLDAASADEMAKLKSGLNLPPGMKLPF